MREGVQEGETGSQRWNCLQESTTQDPRTYDCLARRLHSLAAAYIMPQVSRCDQICFNHKPHTLINFVLTLHRVRTEKLYQQQNAVRSWLDIADRRLTFHKWMMIMLMAALARD